MLSHRGWRRLLLATALVVACGLIMMVWAFQESEVTAVQFDKVTLSHESGGKASLLVNGRGLHDGVRALLLPAQQGADVVDSPPEIVVTLNQWASNGRLAVAATADHRLITIDVTPGQRAAVLGGIKLFPRRTISSELSINGLALVGSRAVVARNNVGLILIDLDNPAAPREIDRLEYTQHFTDLVAAGEAVYALNHNSGLQVVTLAGDHLRARQVPGSQGAWRLAVSGRRLATVSLKSVLDLYELDPQGNAHPVGRMQLPQGVRDLAISREVLYLCFADGQLRGYSLEHWPRLVPCGQLDLQGRPLRLEAAPEENRLLCTLTGKGVGVIDISQPTAPRHAGLINMMRVASNLQVKDGRLFLAGLSGLRILPVEELTNLPPPPDSVYPFEPSQGRVGLLPWENKVFAYNQRDLVLISERGSTASPSSQVARQEVPLLALSEAAGVRLHAIRDGLPDLQPNGHIPISDPASERFGIELGRTRSAAWHNGLLFVLSASRLDIFDGKSAGAPLAVGEYRPRAETVAMAWLEPGFLVLASHSKSYCGFEVLDVSAPAKPKLVGSYAMPKHQWTVGDISDLLIDGTRLFVSRSRLGVEIFDLSDPTQPKLMQRIDTPGNAGKLSLDNGLLIVGDQEEGVFIVDMEGKFGMPVGDYRLPMIPCEVLNHNGQIFVTNSAGGVLRFPAPRKLVPERIVSSRAMTLPVPAEMAPGRYLLTLYDGENSADFPVMLE